MEVAKSTPEDRENLRKIHEMMENLPHGCLAAIIKHSMDLLKVEDFITTKELDEITNQDPEL